MKILKKIGIAIVFIFLVAQFFGPEKNEGDLASVETFIAETNPPVDVQKILETTCYDCHTDKTVYPWYNTITPVNYWLAEHVKEGKKHLNFSAWSTYSLKKKEHKMDELYEEVEEKKMPLDSYTWMHGDANLTQDQIDAVVAWGKKVQAEYKQQLNTK
ncbi:heme-binding domain-containing protein [Polaribacter staleyi]|uniref:heme-binding domain-containing protein n=1 Tax=Polaribacter staleyi TaxID=2022337 RepID=UPI0031BA1C5A